MCVSKCANCRLQLYILAEELATLVTQYKIGQTVKHCTLLLPSTSIAPLAHVTTLCSAVIRKLMQTAKTGSSHRLTKRAEQSAGAGTSRLHLYIMEHVQDGLDGKRGLP